MKQNYIGFARQGNLFGPAVGRGEYAPQLPAGHYKVSYDNEYDDNLMVAKFQPRLDEVLNLGCKEFNDAIGTAEKFLSPEAAIRFQQSGFLLKRSFMFYGPPGTGKSVLSSRISDIAVASKDAIALYPDSYQALERMLEVLNDTDKDRFKVINLEEFDDLVSGHDESQWTTLLDGQFQSTNRLVIATTNYIDKVPQRLLRPGRFSSIVLIPALTSEARDNFLKQKKVETSTRKKMVELTENFTIDELKEVVQSVSLLGESLEVTVQNIRAAKKLGKED